MSIIRDGENCNDNGQHLSRGSKLKNDAKIADKFKDFKPNLSDRKNRLRKVTIEYSDGEVVYNVLNSKEYVYYTKPGAVRVRVSKPRLLVLGKSDR